MISTKVQRKTLFSPTTRWRRSRAISWRRGRRTMFFQYCIIGPKLGHINSWLSANLLSLKGPSSVDSWCSSYLPITVAISASQCCAWMLSTQRQTKKQSTQFQPYSGAPPQVWVLVILHLKLEKSQKCISLTIFLHICNHPILGASCNNPLPG